MWDIMTVFDFILDVVGGAFGDGWELLFDIEVTWFFEMSFGDIVIACLGVSIFISIFLDAIGGVGIIGNRAMGRHTAKRRYQKAQGKVTAKKDFTSNKKILNNMELKSARKRGLK